MEYLRPGVHTERVDSSPPAVAAIRTDIAAFVGIAERGPLDTPVPVQSFRQFRAHFGDFCGQALLAYSVQAFFENGGRRAWIVRVASKREDTGARCASVELGDFTGPFWSLEAESPGGWGNDLEVSLAEQRDGQTTLDLSAGDSRYGVGTSVAGFERGSLVRLTQPTPSGVVLVLWRVVSAVDARLRRVYFVNPEPRAALPYDLPLAGFDGARPVTAESLRYRLLVFRAGELALSVGGLSLVEAHASYGPRRLTRPGYPTSVQRDERLPAPAPLVVLRELVPGGRVVLGASAAPSATVPEPIALAAGRLALTGGTDGLRTLTAADFVGEPTSALDSELVQARKRRGIEALNLVNEIALVAVPDIVVQPEAPPLIDPDPAPPPSPCNACPRPEERPVPRAALDEELPPRFSDDEVFLVQSALVLQCEERGDRFAVLDPPASAAHDDAVGLAAIRAWRARFDTTYAALYYPWLRVVEPRKTATMREIPPSGHALGQYAAFDLEIGVHRAPANRRLAWVQDVTLRVSGGEHELLNPNGINAIVAELGRGVRVMGARTLSSDPDWIYVNVRRLLIMIRKAVDISTQWVTFEPNDGGTRATMTLALSSFLNALWERGALTGKSAEQAFFVKCDDANNPPPARADGFLLAEVGVAPSKPFEFVILRIGRQGNELEIAEAGFLTRAA